MAPRKKPAQPIIPRRSERLRLLREAAEAKAILDALRAETEQINQQLQAQRTLMGELGRQMVAEERVAPQRGRRRRSPLRGVRGGGVRRSRRTESQTVTLSLQQVDLNLIEPLMDEFFHGASEPIAVEAIPDPDGSPLADQELHVDNNSIDVVLDIAALIDYDSESE